MSAAPNARVFALLILFILEITYAQYEVPNVYIQVLKPRGFRASIPDDGKVSLFVFQGNVNRAIGRTDVGSISGEVIQAKDGRWTFEDPNLELKEGDVINYYVFVSANKAGYVKDNLSYTVTAEGTSTGTSTQTSGGSQPSGGGQSSGGGTTGGETVPPAECKATATKLRDGRTACRGQVVFEDNFDTFKSDAWQIEHYIPVYSPDFPFVSYQRLSDDPTVSLEGGYLRITPKLQQRQPGFNETSIYTGSLNLFSGCTASADSCMKEAWGASILPPIVSGKITSKNFAFTYGTVYVRAKLPQGDWLYPEILLEPFLKKYGSVNHNSGIIKIACARGNRELTKGFNDYSNKILYGGAVMDVQCHDNLLSTNTLSDGRQWGDDFHLYAVRWAPDRITLSVDGEEWARIQPAARGLQGRFPSTCTNLPRTLLASGTRMAPFDDHFYITLGVGAGSVTEFPDGVQTGGGQPKPWMNPSSKAVLNFWQDIDAWFPTWNQPQLLVDYVKVVAL